MSSPGPRPAVVRGALQHHRRLREIAGRVQRRDDHRARAVDLDRAVGHTERLGDVRRGKVRLDRVRRPQVRALVLLRVLALRDRHRREVFFGLAGLDRKRRAHSEM